MTDASSAAAVPFASAAVPPVQAAHTPVPGSEGQAPQPWNPAPDVPGVPAQPAPVPDAPAPPDPAEYERLKNTEAEYQRQRQQWDQRDAQQAEQLRQHQQQQVEQQRSYAARQYLAQARQIARNLPEEQADAYIDNAALQIAQSERDFQRQTYEQRIAEQQQQEYATRLLGYPDYLGRQMGLTTEQVELLRNYGDDKTMTAAAQQAQFYNKQVAELRKLTDQSYASQQATQAANSGALAMGGNGTAGGGQRLQPGASDEELDAALAGLLGFAPSR